MSVLVDAKPRPIRTIRVTYNSVSGHLLTALRIYPTENGKFCHDLAHMWPNMGPVLRHLCQINIPYHNSVINQIIENTFKDHKQLLEKVVTKNHEKNEIA